MSEQDANEAPDVVTAVKQGGSLLFWTGVLGVVLGIFCIAAAPFITFTITMFIGIIVIVGGILQIGSGVDMEKGTKGRGWTITGGILAVIVGLFFVINPFGGMKILTWIIAFFLLIEGGLRIAAALELKPAQGWGWFLFGGIASVVLGLMLMAQWPYSAAWFIGTVFGIHALFAGMARITLGLAVRSAAKQALGG